MTTYYDKNVYYNPESCGLTQFAALEEALGWEFSILAVWHHPQSNTYWWAHDSGCSCPTPFENYHFDGPDKTDLNKLEEHTKHLVIEQAQSMEEVSSDAKQRFVEEIARLKL